MASFSFKDDFLPDTFGVKDKDGNGLYGTMPKNDENEIFERSCELGGNAYSFVCSLSDNFDLQKSLLTLSFEITRTMTRPEHMRKSYVKLFSSYSLLCEIIKNEISENAITNPPDESDMKSCAHISEKGFIACFATIFSFLLQGSADTSLSFVDNKIGFKVSVRSKAPIESIPQFALDFCCDVARASGFSLNLRKDGDEIEIFSIIEKAVITYVNISAVTHSEVGEVFGVIELMTLLQKMHAKRKD